jgi:hypothetical protein
MADDPRRRGRDSVAFVGSVIAVPIVDSPVVVTGEACIARVVIGVSVARVACVVRVRIARRVPCARRVDRAS